jgi:hypothetical protein
MPRPHVDWHAVGHAVAAGQPIKEIAQKYGVSRDSIYRRARTGNWRPSRDLVDKLAHQKLQAIVSQRITAALPAIDKVLHGWEERVVGVAEQLVGQIADRVQDSPKPDALAKLAAALSSADLVGRRSLGLDRETTDTTVMPVLLVLSESGKGLLMDASDNEPDPEK